MTIPSLLEDSIHSDGQMCRKTTTTSSKTRRRAPRWAPSLNVPAVRTLVMVSPDAFFSRQLQAFGLPLRESGDYSSAWRTDWRGFARKPDQRHHAWPMVIKFGEPSHPNPLPKDRRAIRKRGQNQPSTRAQRSSSPTSWPIRCAPFTFGTDGAVCARFWSAVETGTSSYATTGRSFRSAYRRRLGWRRRCGMSAVPTARHHIWAT
jgi:hypothetical protein